MKCIPSTLAIALIAITANASASQVIELQDGRKVQLNDDFTWRYVQPENTNQDTTLTVAAPIVSSQRGTTLTLERGKPTLQLSDSGVDIVIGAASYQNGKVVLPTAITNQSSLSVINVQLKIELLDSQGKKLAEQETVVWQSIKRLAETYLRPKTAAEGRVIEIEVPKAEGYQLIATVSNLETR
ncbi:DUF3157 family protein [Vibrio sp. Y2-5]|uniref:DUF3157 family protein n=1 Tax=Vibrio sp. Y2-5 TaxID=2743977 RepID=UPI001661065F|nr:DUF3157 family protein [Vibrio sp. Y2-5]MBD0788780.1 DUF3157 family protein [Vibrio sp. Y2-5]